MIVEEGPKTRLRQCGDRRGHHGTISAIALRCPIRRVASADVPVPFSPVLENAYRPDVPRIVEAARAVMTY